MLLKPLGNYPFSLRIIKVIYLICLNLFSRLQKNRAERRYGVIGNRSQQELTPLGIDDDSDNENPLFEQTPSRSHMVP